MVKSLIITPLYRPDNGGVNTMMYMIARHLPHDEVVVLAAAADGDETFDRQSGLRVYRQSKTVTGWHKVAYRLAQRISPSFGKSILFLPAAWRLIRQERVDVVQCAHIQLGFCAWLLRWL